MKINTRTVENIKTGIIVVLFLSTMLLLYFFCYQTPYDKYKLAEIPNNKNAIPIQELILPEEIKVSFGEEKYCVMPVEMNDIWYSNDSTDYSIIDEFKKFSASENIFVEEISKEKYEVAMEFRYIKASFAYSVPFGELCDVYKIKKPSTYNNITNMTSLMYSEGSKEGMFVSDDIGKKYYWLFSDKDVTTFSKVISTVENSQHALFHSLGTFLNIENETMLPMDMEATKVYIPFTQELYPDQTEAINVMAKRFFGKNFDFIRKIKEVSGKIIYMYGYGEKVFVVNVNGSMEYKKEFNNENYVSKTFFESLEIATNFVSGNNEFSEGITETVYPYLKDVEYLKDKKGYRFKYGEIINGSELIYKEGETIEVEIIGGQVTSYQRNIIKVDENYIEEASKDMEPEIVSAINMIAQNYEYLYDAMVQTDSFLEASVESNSANTVEDISKDISQVKTGYLRDDATSMVKPVWIVVAGKAKAYFDLYNYSPISFTKVVE